jgi:DIS3-like exonuclease 2
MIYLKFFIFKECGPFDEKATVIQINDRSFDVLIVNLGIPKRIYCDVKLISNYLN